MYKYKMPDGKVIKLKRVLWKNNRRLFKTLVVISILLLILIWKSYLLYNLKLGSTIAIAIAFIVICFNRNKQIRTSHYLGYETLTELTQVQIEDV